MMNKYLSVWALSARATLCKALLITAAAALLSGVLLWRCPGVTTELYAYDEDENGGLTPVYEERIVYPDEAPGKSLMAIPAGAGFAAIMAVLSLNGCGYGAKTDYTVRRLRIPESKLNLLWATHSGMCLLLYWAVLAVTAYAALTLWCSARAAEGGQYAYLYSSPQTVMLAFYSSKYLHHLLPLRDAVIWGENLMLWLVCSCSAVHFSHRQRRGKFSLSPFAAPLAILSFSRPMGDLMNYLILAGAGIALGYLLPSLLGDNDDDGPPPRSFAPEGTAQSALLGAADVSQERGGRHEA